MIPFAYQISACGRSAALGAINRPDGDLAPNRGEGAAPTTTAENEKSTAPMCFDSDFDTEITEHQPSVAETPNQLA